MKQIVTLLVCCLVSTFLSTVSLGTPPSAEAADKPTIWVSTDARLVGNGSDSVNQLSVDLPHAVRKALTKAGYRVVLTEDKPHDLVARLLVNTDMRYAVFDAWVLFKKTTMVLERDGVEVGTFEYQSDESGGHFKSYGEEGERYAVNAAQALVADLDTSPVIAALVNKNIHLAAAPRDLPLAPSAAADTTPPVILITSPQVTRGVQVVAKESRVPVIGRATDDSGIAVVTINGQPAVVDKLGNFSAALLLKPGESTVSVAAVDIHNNQALERFTVKVEAETSAIIPPAVVAPGRNYALIIGINQYHKLDRLRTAAGDAAEVAEVLRDQYGFDTRVILDGKATRSAILKELNDLKTALNPEDRLLIYYAGHGYNDMETETSYWLPVEAERNDPTNWIEARSITDQLKRTRAKQVLVVADSCYSGTIARAIDPSLSGRGTRENYLQKLMEKPSRVLISSGGNEPVTDAGGASGHSIFAEVFINALKNPTDTVFTAEELLTQRIKESVAGRADQTPEYKVIRNSGHDGGDFVFMKPLPPAQPLPAQPQPQPAQSQPAQPVQPQSTQPPQPAQAPAQPVQPQQSVQLHSEVPSPAVPTSPNL